MADGTWQRDSAAPRRAAMPLASALCAAALLSQIGCASVAIKGRETLRVGPLRDVAVVPRAVDQTAVGIDAGTDALTDQELAAIAAALPGELARALNERATLIAGNDSRVLGTARILNCRLRAGAGRVHTVYEARCRVSVDVEGVPIVELHTEALRRVRSRAISEDEAKAITKLVRNPLLSAPDARQALVAALQAAAMLLVDGALPPPPDAPLAPSTSRRQRAALARDRLARSKDAKSDRARAALFDLSASGAPADAEAVLPFLVHDDLAVRITAVSALGELCAPWSAERLEPLTVEHGGEPELRAAAKRALTKVRTCAKFAR